MTDTPGDPDLEGRGAKCPYCGEKNIVYEGLTCEHYAGYFNVSENAWELERHVMSKLQKVLEDEFKKIEKQIELGDPTKKKELKLLNKIVDGGLGAYESGRMEEILPDAAYAYDEEDVSVGPMDSANCQMMFLDQKGFDAARDFLKCVK